MIRTNLFTGLRWLAVVGLATLLAYLVFDMHRLRLPQASLSLSETEFLTSVATTPPTKEDGWRRVTLPHDWGRDTIDAQQGWYRFRLRLNVPPDRLWGIYLPSVSMNAAVYLNGELLGSGGRFEDPVARNWNRPLYFWIPNGLLAPGENTIHVRLKTDPAPTGLLGAIHLGPDSEMQRAYQTRLFIKHSLSQAAIIILVVMGLFIGLLWWHRRGDSLYGWYAGAALIWATYSLNLVIQNIPVPTAVWDWAKYTSILWLPVFATLFNHRFLGLQRPRLERTLVAVALAGAVALAIVPVPWLYPLGMRVTSTTALLLGLYPVGLLLLHSWRSVRLDVLLLMTSGALMIVLGTHDLLVVNSLIGRSDGMFLHYAAPLVLGAYGWILLRRFVTALTESETLGRDLAQRVEERTRDLAKSHEQLRALERQHVLTEERARIMRDMHDGLGGHLVAALAALERAPAGETLLRKSLEQALDELRVMIDSLEEVDGDLLTLLGMLRQRLEPRLTHAGIAVRWQVRPVPALAELNPQLALQVLRIAQEAITNIIKHARATTLTLTTEPMNTGDGCTWVQIEISDDGCGLRDTNGGGRGLQNMRQRAAAIGARLTIEQRERGTAVVLQLPVATP